MTSTIVSPAELAAKESIARMYKCIDERKSFILEAGAGAGKTYSLVKALTYLIDKQGHSLMRRHQQIACITFTNVASDEIKSRTDGHPVILSSTIHAFCWALIKNFQPNLREELPKLSGWTERLSEAGGICTRSITYDLGYPKVNEGNISLGHNDILLLTVILMDNKKFRKLFVSRYPILFIDEYQDTDKDFTNAIKKHFLAAEDKPLIGFFGDHWQKIYPTGCGKIEHPSLEVIGKQANFRSVKAIVDGLNNMRPALPQQIEDPNEKGSVAIYHTNDWVGTRRNGAHWADDLPADVANNHLDTLIEHLTTEGWEFESTTTKILMLTHRVLATKQGYSNLAEVFPYNDAFIKKEDDHIAFFVDTLEPVCNAYENKRFGEMFAVLGGRIPAIHSHVDKVEWVRDMDALIAMRSSGKPVGTILDFLRQTKRIHLPEAVERREKELEQAEHDPNSEESSSVQRLRKLRDISYQEVIALAQFIDDKTPFSTKHGVKGAEFENVLVVVGRGWNHYDFNKFLELASNPNEIPPDQRDFFERNRNLFYVVCSRPKKRLAVLFTQKLSDKAMNTLTDWFGNQTIYSL